MSLVQNTQQHDIHEKGILDTTEELRRTLGIENRKVDKIRWVTWLLIPHGRLLVPSDQCFFEDSTLAVAKTLKGRLTPDEWKPLIASSMIFEFDKGIQRRLHALRPLRYVLVFTVVSLPLLLLRVSFPSVTWPTLPTVVGVFAALFVISLFFWDFSLARQRLRLASDKKALKIVDRGIFIKTLLKIEAMELPDIKSRQGEKHSGWSMQRSQWPSIDRRISNIQSI